MVSAGKQRSRRQFNSAEKGTLMGDRSPKSNQKKATQKESKASSADEKKKAEVAAKQAVFKKK